MQNLFCWGKPFHVWNFALKCDNSAPIHATDSAMVPVLLMRGVSSQDFEPRFGGAISLSTMPNGGSRFSEKESIVKERFSGVLALINWRSMQN
jgi:hypothetical protein